MLMERHGIRGKKSTNRAFYWYYPHAHGSGHLPSAAIRVGDYKLIWHIKEDRTELYNIRKDVSETQELSNYLPVKAEELKQKLLSWIENTKKNY